MTVKKPVPETAEQRANRELIEKIAGNLGSLADSVSSLMNGPLNKRALIVLLASSSKMSQVDVQKVLTALTELRKDWLNK